MNHNLSDIIAAAKAHKTVDLPPVHKWNPAYCGEMDMVIKRDGTWWHEGSPIGREALVKLFASILRKDDDGITYLVTPVEKIAIQVERAHFTIIRMDVDTEGGLDHQSVYFTTNLGEVIPLGPDHALQMKPDPKTGDLIPFINVRANLEACLSRPVYYELASHLCQDEAQEKGNWGIYSQGLFFPLSFEDMEL